MEPARVLDLSQFQESLAAYFSSQPDLVLAYLFGSYGRGQAGPLSDVDVAVLLAGDPDNGACLDRRMDLVWDLTGVLHFDDVDVVVLNQAPPALRYRVLRDGKLLFCGDDDARIMFYLRTVNEYLDFKPVLERHERAIFERARRGELFDGYNPYRGALERHRHLRERLARTPGSDPGGVPE